MKTTAFVLALGTVLLWMALFDRVEGITNCDVADSEVALDAIETEFLVLLNRYRDEHGVAMLVSNAHLNRAAAWMGVDLRTSAFSHTDSLGRSPFARMIACGMAGNGENLAGGFSSAQSVLDAWIASPGHQANLVGSSYRQVGIARIVGGPYGVNWVLDLASSAPVPVTAVTGTATASATMTATRPPRPTATPTPVPYQHTQLCRRPSLVLCVIAQPAAYDGP